MLTCQFDAQDGRLAAWCPGPHCERQQVKARFVYPDNGRAFFDRFFRKGGPALVVPALDCCLVALGSPFDRLLRAPARLPEQATDMIALVAHAEGAPDYLGDAAGRPHIAAKTPSFCPTRQQGWDPRPLLGTHARPEPRWWPVLQRFDASVSSPLDPLADRAFAHPQRNGDISLFPAQLFQLPGALAPLPAPVGFLRCSQASYSTMAPRLHFSSPRSVDPAPPRAGPPLTSRLWPGNGAAPADRPSSSGPDAARICVWSRPPSRARGG